MTRRRRVAVEVLGPPPIAAALLQVAAVIGTGELGALKLAPFLLVFGYLLAAAPSLVYAAVLELAFARGLDPRSWRAVLLSAALGAASGVPIGLVVGSPRAAGSTAAGFAALGLLTGAAMGLLVRAWSGAEARPARLAPAPAPDRSAT